MYLELKKFHMIGERDDSPGLSGSRAWSGIDGVTCGFDQRTVMRGRMKASRPAIRETIVGANAAPYRWGG